MKKLLAIFALAALIVAGTALWSAPSLHAASEVRVALVIGNAAYGPETGQLKNPVNDAQLMAKTLGLVGFAVDIVENADRKRMRQAIVDFGKKLKAAGPDVVGMFYFAGHGMQVEGRNWLVATGARMESDIDLEDGAISVDAVVREMNTAKGRLNIVILDACRNNPFTRGFRGAERGLARLDAPNTVIGFATALGDVAADGAGPNSPYANALAEEIAGSSDPIETVLRKVTKRVKDATAQKQVPFVSFSSDYEFRFRAPDAQAARPTEQVASGAVGPLTPMGSLRAGSPDGLVPPWTGGVGRSAAAFNPASQHPPNPFPADRPTVTITAANLAKFSAHVLDGHKALFQRYPTYTMRIYPSRRNCALPQSVYSADDVNALVSALTSNGDGVASGIRGLPFPVRNPTAEQLMWNVKLRFNEHKWTRQFASAPVQTSGKFSLMRVQDEAIVRWADPAARTIGDLENLSYFYVAHIIEPPRLAGNVTLIHETLNAAIAPRKAWSYTPGTRRVRKAPDIGYDNPGFSTDGMATWDQFGGFNGRLDSYDWSNKGRQVAYIPYNDYDLLKTTYVSLLKPGHPDTASIRYEAHRVWNVEATLKPSARHIYARRVFHIDEDSYVVAGAEAYDGRGQLWRFQELMTVNFYHVPLCGIAGHFVHDLQSGRYLAYELISEEPPINFFAKNLNEGRYVPESVGELGVR